MLKHCVITVLAGRDSLVLYAQGNTFITMLIQQSGVVIGNTRIKGLYYADDIVLFAENEHCLQDMLNIADMFAKNWGLSFNSKKSQVLIIGKKVTDKDWFLSNKTIKETQAYKYLGTIINGNSRIPSTLMTTWLPRLKTLNRMSDIHFPNTWI